MSLDALPAAMREVIFRRVDEFDFHALHAGPACYDGSCACEHECRQRLASVVAECISLDKGKVV